MSISRTCDRCGMIMGNADGIKSSYDASIYFGDSAEPEISFEDLCSECTHELKGIMKSFSSMSREQPVEKPRPYAEPVPEEPIPIPEHQERAEMPLANGVIRTFPTRNHSRQEQGDTEI